MEVVGDDGTIDGRSQTREGKRWDKLFLSLHLSEYPSYNSQNM